jgi:glycosyltransferase involved in cell wall biosynthesis
VARSIFFYTDSRIFGGAEHALFMLIRQLDPARWRSVLLLEAGEDIEPLAERARAAGAEVRLIDPLPLGLLGARRMLGLTRFLRAERPSVFHAHLSWPLAAKYGLAAAVAARIPAVVATVQLVPDFPIGRSSHVQLRVLSALVDRYIAVSHDIARRLVDEFHWPRRKIDVIYNAVDLERFDRPSTARIRAELGAEGRPIVLTPARLDPQKGHRVLLDAAASLPGVVFALAGDGPERGALEARSRILGIDDRVHFLGFRHDIPDLLATADVFLLPSLYEGSSLAVLEAMAARRAVVSSDIGGTRELIEHRRSGVLVPPGDAGAVAAALRELLADETLRSRLAGRGRERVEREYTADAMADATQRVYESVLARA